MLSNRALVKLPLVEGEGTSFKSMHYDVGINVELWLKDILHNIIHLNNERNGGKAGEQSSFDMQ